MSGAGAGFGRSHFLSDVTKTEDFVLSTCREFADPIQFQRRSRSAMVRTTRKWCLLHILSLQAACTEAESRLPIAEIPKKHLR